MSLEEEEIRVPEIEGVLAEYEEFKQEDDRRWQELVNLGAGTWTKDWTEGTVSSVKDFGIFVWIWEHREILVHKQNIPEELLKSDNKFPEKVPDNQKVKVGQQIKLKLKYLEATNKQEAKVTGSLKDQS